MSELTKCATCGNMKTWTVIFPPHGDYLGTGSPRYRDELGDCYDARGAALFDMKTAHKAAQSFEDGTAHRLSARVAKRLPGNRLPLSRKRTLKRDRRNRVVRRLRRKQAEKSVQMLLSAASVIFGGGGPFTSRTPDAIFNL